MNTPETVPPDAVIDLKGLRCPGPLLGAKRLLDELAEGETLLMISDCPGTRDDLFAWARVTGNQVTASGRRADGGHGYLIRKGRAERPPAQAVLDVRGAVCPGPIVEAHRLLDHLRPGEVLHLISDCPGVERDVTGWARTLGVTLLATAEIDPGTYEFFLRKG